jgi:hypothetical protein
MFVRRALLSAAVITFATGALASPTKEECVDANARGQVARKQQQLHVAREAFRTCADSVCPSVVRRDCATRVDEVERAIPTIVVEVTAGGQKVDNATVVVDGAPFVSHGSATEIDPGQHHFVFRVAGKPDIVREVAVDEGARDQVVSAAFEEAPKKNPGFVALGIGVAAAGLGGIVLGSIFGAATIASWGSVKNECANAATCDYTRATSDRNQALVWATASDIAFVVGGVLLASGITIVVLGLRVAPAAGPRTIGFAGAF